MKISYFVVFVKDIDRSLEVYRDVLDLEVAHRYTEDDGTEAAFVVEKGEPPMKNKAMIELVTVKAGEEPHPSGFLVGIEVESLEAKTALMLERGHRLTEGPYSPAPGVAISHFEGPDGEAIGLMELSA